MRNKKLKGTGVALITPFLEDYRIDFQSLDNLIDSLIDYVDYFVVLGTTAESSTLSIDEQYGVIEFISKKVQNRIPLVLGVGGNNTNYIINRIKELNLESFEAILSVVPYYNKPTQQGLIAHYSSIAEISPVDIILYNVPSRTSLNMSAESIGFLAHKYPNIIGVKDASGSIEGCMSLFHMCPDDFMIISGDDKMTFPILTLGGAGVISVQAMSFPLIFSKMVQYVFEGKLNEARKYHFKLLNSVDMFYIEGNPAGVKAALHIQGIISSNQVRLPLLKMSPNNAAKFKKFLN